MPLETTREAVRPTPIEAKYLITPELPEFPPAGDYGASDIRARLCVPALGAWAVFGLNLKDKVEARQRAAVVIIDEETRLRGAEADVLDELSSADTAD